MPELLQDEREVGHPERGQDLQQGVPADVPYVLGPALQHLADLGQEAGQVLVEGPAGQGLEELDCGQGDGDAQDLIILGDAVTGLLVMFVALDLKFIRVTHTRN